MITLHILLFVVVALVIGDVHVNGFTFGQKKSASTPKTKSSPFLEEALASYPYVFKSDQDKAECIANFNEIARLYGDKEAVKMVKDSSKVLTFNRENFAPCLESWEEQFGLESAKAMVQRNPGLLGVRPAQVRKQYCTIIQFFLYYILYIHAIDEKRMLQLTFKIYCKLVQNYAQCRLIMLRQAWLYHISLQQYVNRYFGLPLLLHYFMHLRRVYAPNCWIITVRLLKVHNK